MVLWLDSLAQPYLISDFLPRLEETENTTENYRARTAELRRDILENNAEKERTQNSLESARDILNQVRAAREEAEELWREKYLLNQSERLEERNRVKDLLAQVRALLSYQTIPLIKLFQLKQLRDAEPRKVQNVSDLNSKLVEKEREIHKLIEENISESELYLKQ